MLGALSVWSASGGVGAVAPSPAWRSSSRTWRCCTPTTPSSISAIGPVRPSARRLRACAGTPGSRCHRAGRRALPMGSHLLLHAGDRQSAALAAGARRLPRPVGVGTFVVDVVLIVVYLRTTEEEIGDVAELPERPPRPPQERRVEFQLGELGWCRRAAEQDVRLAGTAAPGPRGDRHVGPRRPASRASPARNGSCGSGRVEITYAGNPGVTLPLSAYQAVKGLLRRRAEDRRRSS